MASLSDAEWEVMNVLWSADELTLAEIRERLDGAGKRWAGNTVQTFDQIINHMIMDAWYMVTEYHLNLGPSDAPGAGCPIGMGRRSPGSTMSGNCWRT